MNFERDLTFFVHVSFYFIQQINMYEETNGMKKNKNSSQNHDKSELNKQQQHNSQKNSPLVELKK